MGTRSRCDAHYSRTWALYSSGWLVRFYNHLHISQTRTGLCVRCWIITQEASRCLYRLVSLQGNARVADSRHEDPHRCSGRITLKIVTRISLNTYLPSAKFLPGSMQVSGTNGCPCARGTALESLCRERIRRGAHNIGR